MKKLFFILSLCILTYSCENEESLPPQLESLALEDTTLYLNIGESYKLNFLTVPEEAVNDLYDISCSIQSGQNLDMSYAYYYAADGITITPYGFGESTLIISGSYYHMDNYYFSRGNYSNLNGYRVSSPNSMIENNRWSLSCKVIVGGNLEITIPTDHITATTAELKCNEEVAKNCSKINISLSDRRYGTYWKTFDIVTNTDSFLLSGLIPGTKYSGTVQLYAKTSNGGYNSDDYKESKISFSTEEPEIDIEPTFTKATITLDEESNSVCSSISISLTDKDNSTNSITTELHRNSSNEYTIYNLRPDTQYEGYILLRGSSNDSDLIPISFSTKEIDLKMSLSYDNYYNFGSNHYLYLNLSIENDKTYAENNILYRVGCQFSKTADFQNITNSNKDYNEELNPQEYEIYTSWYEYISTYYCRPYIELNSGEVIYGEHYEFDVSSRTLTKHSIK